MRLSLRTAPGSMERLFAPMAESAEGGPDRMLGHEDFFFPMVITDRAAGDERVTILLGQSACAGGWRNLPVFMDPAYYTDAKAGGGEAIKEAAGAFSYSASWSVHAFCPPPRGSSPASVAPPARNAPACLRHNAGIAAPLRGNTVPLKCGRRKYANLSPPTDSRLTPPGVHDWLQMNHDRRAPTDALRAHSVLGETGHRRSRSSGASCTPVGVADYLVGADRFFHSRRARQYRVLRSSRVPFRAARHRCSNLLGRNCWARLIERAPPLESPPHRQLRPAVSRDSSTTADPAHRRQCPTFAQQVPVPLIPPSRAVRDDHEKSPSSHRPGPPSSDSPTAPNTLHRPG